MSTERERCPTCDHELAPVAEFRPGGLCRARFGYGHPGPSVDWRRRCLAAEAQLAGVRPRRENAALVAKVMGIVGCGAHLVDGRPCDECVDVTREVLDAIDAHERTEGRAGDGEGER